VRSGGDPLTKNSFGRSLLDHFDVEHLGAGLKEKYMAPSTTDNDGGGNDAAYIDNQNNGNDASSPSSSRSKATKASRNSGQRPKSRRSSSKSDIDMAAAVHKLQAEINQNAA
jgi:hypothetical protein